MAFAPVLVPVSLPATDGKSEYHRLHSNRRFRKDSVPPESSHPRRAPYPMHSLPIHTAPPTPITRYENDSVSCQPKPGDIFTRPANTNRKRGFSTRPSRSVRITRQTHGQLFEKTDTVKNGQHNRGYDTKGVHTDCPSKRITRNEALASGCYKTEKRLLFHIRHTEDGEMYAAVGTYLQQGGMPLE